MATYYVSAATGSDSDDGLSEGNAWLTIDKAMNTVAAGDKVYIKADGDYAETATIDTVGTAIAPIVFEGYTTTPGDGGMATITGSSSRANGIIATALGNVPIYYVFKNLRVTACTGVGWNIGTNADHVVFKNCRADANGSWGFQCDNWARFENCQSFGNTANGGYDVDDFCVFVGCTAHSNTGAGFQCGAGSGVLIGVFFGCVAYSNTGDNFPCTTNGGAVFINCTSDGDGKDSDTGFNQSNASLEASTIINCIAYDCTTGIAHGRDIGELAISRNNLVNGNTAAYSNAATFTGEVTSAPDFVGEASADYRLNTTSPAKAAGYDGGLLGTGAASKIDIGAIQREEPAPGGGGSRNVIL